MQPIIDALNSYLRNELSAVETYDVALGNVKQLGMSALLEDSKRSHLARVELLRRRIVQLGGHPTENPGAWRLLAEAMEAGTKLDHKVNISALEEFEYLDLQRYRDELLKLDEQTQLLVREHVLPAQERTYRTIKSIRTTLS
jgi:bacterioferritin (cytochrome b1)